LIESFWRNMESPVHGLYVRVAVIDAFVLEG
jgi:hypothetical protein